MGLWINKFHDKQDKEWSLAWAKYSWADSHNFARVPLLQEYIFIFPQVHSRQINLAHTHLHTHKHIESRIESAFISGRAKCKAHEWNIRNH